MEKRLDEIKKKLHSSSLKLTPQRESTVRVLLQYADDHLSAEDVYILVKKTNSEIGLATVYRTLELLNELGIVNKVNFGDGITRFDLRDPQAKRSHHHLICNLCGNVREIKEDLLETVEYEVKKRFSFHVDDHKLVFFGKCQNCWQDSSNKQN